MIFMNKKHWKSFKKQKTHIYFVNSILLSENSSIKILSWLLKQRIEII